MKTTLKSFPFGNGFWRSGQREFEPDEGCDKFKDIRRKFLRKVTRTEYLKADTYLLIEGEKV